MKKNVLWITRTGVLLALLIVMQAVLIPFGNTIITGSVVNLILIVSVMLNGLISGVFIAALSPVCAKILGIGPVLWVLIPFIIAGNIILALTWNFLGNKNFGNVITSHIAAMITGAILKFLVLYTGITKIAVPFLLELPEHQAIAISHAFSIPQLITALIGGVIAIMALPALKNALKNLR